ncbi:MAG: hypothetical protein ABIJ57_08615 [Pseudomonadota bacterium]
MWGQDLKEPVVTMLLDVLALQSVGCPVERHELRNSEWILLGIVKAELALIGAEEKEAIEGKSNGTARQRGSIIYDIGDRRKQGSR